MRDVLGSSHHSLACGSPGVLIILQPGVLSAPLPLVAIEKMIKVLKLFAIYNIIK